MVVQNSPARSGIDVGSVIDGTYTIEAMIGRGGMGEVFLASHNRLAGKKVAIKMLHAELGSDDVLTRFKREADIASQLDHPNIVKVEDYKFLPDGTPYIVYEYLQGESLAQRLKEVGALPVDQTLSILRQVGSALAAAHRAGVVHRDLKPQNIFLCPSEVDGRATELAKVLDFGISKMRGSQTVKTQESSLLGTPQYMAPEQATGQHSIVDERTDIFALGAIVYEMLAGHPAFSGASIPEVVFKVVYEQPVPLATQVTTLPATIAAAVAKAMEKAAGDRYASVPEFIEALTGAPLSVMRRPSSSLPPSERKSSGFDAFAQTMGSGDRSLPGATVTVPPPVRASSPTVDSQHDAAIPALTSVKPANLDAKLAAAELAGPSPKPESPPKRRSPALIVGLVLGTGALVAGGMYLVMRDRGGTPHDSRRDHREPIATERGERDRPRVDRNLPPEPVEREPAAHTKPAPTSTDAKPEVKPEVKKDPPKVDPKTTKVDAKKDKPIAESDAGDELVKQRLKDAETAMHDKTYDRAEQLSNSVIASENAGPGQKAHAYALRGVVACIVHNSEENARISLRQLDDFPRLRRHLIAACHAEGHLMSED